jgi:glutamate-1-semialdehyde 2,1-aminomutase
VYFAPAMFEAGFVSAQHTDAVIDETVEAARRVFKRIG